MVERTGVETRLAFKGASHMLRHACGYTLANNGHDTRALQVYLGHKNIQHTVRYTELSPMRFKDFWSSNVRSRGFPEVVKNRGRRAQLQLQMCRRTFFEWLAARPPYRLGRSDGGERPKTDGERGLPAVVSTPFITVKRSISSSEIPSLDG
jgi:hypothetical protein